MIRAVSRIGAGVAFLIVLPGVSLPQAGAAGPGGRSRFLHIDCGAFCPGGSVEWKARFDDATVADGYGYSVVGRTYMGAAPDAYCWFFTQRGTVTIHCPKRIQGTLYLHFLDLNNNHRRQTVTVGEKYRDMIEEFLRPDGTWRQYKLSADDTADGTIVIEFVKKAGANAVISRIDFVPAGVEDALLPEQSAAAATVEGMIQWDWLRQERLKRRRPGCQAAVADVLQRGAALLGDLRQLGADDAVGVATEELSRCSARYDQLAEQQQNGADVSSKWNGLYFDARWAVRELAFANPLLDFDELLFVKRFTPRIGHQCSHHVGSAQVPGSDLCILKGLSPDGQVRSVLGDQLPTGAIGRPDLSFDGRTIIFPYAAPRADPTPYPYGKPGWEGGACLAYQLYEVSVDGSQLRQLTTGPHENTEPCYLPDGRVCFTSSRCNRFVQCGDWAIVFSMVTMNRDGSAVRPITEAKEGEWFPSVLDDGRIIYMRWEYVLKPFNTIQYLWTVNPDGTGATLAYGEHYWFSAGPRSFIEARQIPGTSKVIATGAAHHNCGVGPICIVDLAQNRGDAGGLVRVTPEVRYPETDEPLKPEHTAGWYNAPYPLSEQYFLVCYSFEAPHNAPAGYGLYLMDVHGNKELIYRDPERSCYSPIPLRPRRVPPVLASQFDRAANSETGTMMMLDVYQGLEGVERGAVKYLRVLETVPKSYHSNPQRLDIGIGSGWDPRIILGTVPVEQDGSAYFEVPAGKPIFFEALDQNFQDIRRMRSFTNLQPGEQVSCVGCHESYGSSPPNRAVIAMTQTPSRIEPPPWGAVPMSFPRIIQPVLDRHCIQCHNGTQGEDKSFDLRGDHLVLAQGADDQTPGPPYPKPTHKVSASFVSLLKYVDYTKLNGYEGGDLPVAPYSVGSHRSRLVEILDAGHYGVKLNSAGRRALVAWIDCNAPYLGGWDEYAMPEPPLEAMSAE